MDSSRRSAMETTKFIYDKGGKEGLVWGRKMFQEKTDPWLASYKARMRSTDGLDIEVLEKQNHKLQMLIHYLACYVSV